jgi:hypothetical protein
MNRDPDFMKHAISKYSKQKKMNPMLLKKAVNNEFDQIFENLTSEAILYFKDFNLWSDNKYQNFRDFFDMKHIFRHCNTIYKCRKSINQELMEHYKISSKEISISASPQAMIEDRLKLELALCSSLEHLKNRYISKIFLDGTALSDIVSLVESPANLKTMSSQSRDSHMPVVKYLGRETQNDISKNCSESLKNIGKLHHQRIICEEYTVEVINKLVVDWKMLFLLSNSGDAGKFCDKCCCAKNERQLFEKIHPIRSVELINGLKADIEKDVLHCKINTFLNLLKHIASKRRNEHVYELIEKSMRRYPKLATFSFRTKERTSEDADYGNEQKEPKKLKGPAIDEFVLNYQIILRAIGLSNLEHFIFKLQIIIIYGYLTACTSILEKHRDMNFYRKMNKVLGRCLRVYSISTKWSWYFHWQIQHSADDIERLLEENLSLAMLQNQAAESKHAATETYKERASNHNNDMSQGFMIDLRRLYLASSRNFRWLGTETKQTLIDDNNEDENYDENSFPNAVDIIESGVFDELLLPTSEEIVTRRTRATNRFIKNIMREIHLYVEDLSQSDWSRSMKKLFGNDFCSTDLPSIYNSYPITNDSNLSHFQQVDESFDSKLLMTGESSITEITNFNDDVEMESALQESSMFENQFVYSLWKNYKQQ